MKILLIGTGSIGRRHIASLRRLLPEPRWIFLRRTATVDALSEELGAQVFDDLDAALATGPDMAVLATPSSLHVDCLPRLLAAGLPLYVEKPLVSERAHLVQVQDALRAAAGSAPIVMGCNLRFLPSLLRMRDLVKQGHLGRIVRADFQAGQWLPDWRPQQDYRQGYSASRALGGGVLLDLIHEIDAARWLLGEFADVHAFVSHGSSLEIDSEHAACIVLRQNPGAIATVSLDYVSRRPLRCYRVVGDEASLVWDLPARRLELHGPSGVELLSAEAEDFNVAATYPAAMGELLQAMAEGRPTVQPLEEGIRTMELLLDIKERASS